jgi:DNA repair exonuclease SbcCD ATPase subunit
MSKTEMARQSAAANNEKRADELAQRMNQLTHDKHQSAEELASILEPLAQAMAALTEETRQTLASIERKAEQQAETFNQQIKNSARSYQEAAKEAQKASNNLHDAANRMQWTHYLMTMAVAVLSALLTSVFWLLLNPPTVNNLIDSAAVAEHLKPAVIEALKRSRGK